MAPQFTAYALYPPPSFAKFLTPSQCADVTLADPKNVPVVNASTCFNSSNIDFRYLYTTAHFSNDGVVVAPPWIGVLILSALAVVMGYEF